MISAKQPAPNSSLVNTFQGALDEQFLQLLQLQDDNSSPFVVEVLNLSIEDGESRRLGR
jgi:hypothetical protein